METLTGRAVRFVSTLCLPSLWSPASFFASRRVRFEVLLGLLLPLTSHYRVNLNPQD